MRLPHVSFPSTLRGRMILGGVLLIIIGLAGTGAWFWQRNQAYLLSPTAAVDKLNTAIANKDALLFTEVVDCRLLSLYLVKALTGAPGDVFIPADADLKKLQQHEDKVQNVLLSLFTGTPLPKFPSQQIVPVIPDDLLAQLAAKPFTLAGEDDTLCRAETTFSHPVLGDALPLRLLLQRSHNRWVVTRILNAMELADAYQRAIDDEFRRRKEKEGLTLKEQKMTLARYLPDIVCQGSITQISGGLPLLILSLQTKENPGPESVDAWAITFELTDASGQQQANPRITSNSKLFVGSGISDTWSVELSEAEYQRLESAGPLTCHGNPDYMILGDGKIFKASSL